MHFGALLVSWNSWYASHLLETVDLVHQCLKSWRQPAVGICYLFVQCHNFDMDQAGMKKQLLQLNTLLRFLDPGLHNYLGMLCDAYFMHLTSDSCRSAASFILTDLQSVYVREIISTHYVSLGSLPSFDCATGMSPSYFIHVGVLSFIHFMNCLLQKAKTPATCTFASVGC